MQIEDIGLDQIDMGDINVRKHIDPDELEELMDSIRVLGLLQPIVVMRQGNGGLPYKLIIGQRRLLAYKELKEGTIPARILDEIDRKTGLALSLGENVQRSELTHEDIAETVTELFKLYDRDDSKVADATGMSLVMVRRYIKVSEYVSNYASGLLKEGRASLMDVQRALEAAQWDVGKADNLLEKIVGMVREEKKRLSRYASEHPQADIEDMVEVAKKLGIQRKISVDLTDTIRDGLQKATETMQMEAEEIAALALKEWLEKKGFIL